MQQVDLGRQQLLERLKPLKSESLKKQNRYSNYFFPLQREQSLISCCGNHLLRTDEDICYLTDYICTYFYYILSPAVLSSHYCTT